MYDPTDEPICRRTLREVVALSTLSSIWQGYAPHEVAGSLAEVLISTLPLSFVYVRLDSGIGSDATEFAHTKGFPATARQASAIGQSLAQWLKNGDPTLQHSVRNPVGNGTVRLLRAPLGQDGSEGVVVAGSISAAFPGEDDRVRLSVSANQAGIVLQHWRAKEQLRQSEAVWEEAERLANVGSWSWSIASNKLFWSDEHYRIYGLEPQSVPATYERCLASIHPADRARVAIKIEQAQQDHQPFECVFQLVRPDGDIRITKIRAHVVIDKNDVPVRMIGTIQDITDQTRQEEALRASEARYHIFVDHADSSMFLHDAAGHIVDVNQHACEALGYSRDELIGDTLATFNPDASEIIAERMSLLAQIQSLAFDSLYLRKDGSKFPVAVRIRRFEVDGETFALSLAYDITERMQTEKALRTYAAQLRDLSVRAIDVQEQDRRHLARELHDEIGQVLNAISVNLHALTLDCENTSKPRLEESISIIDRAIHQVHDLAARGSIPNIECVGGFQA